MTNERISQLEAEIAQLRAESEERLQNCAALVAEVERLRAEVTRPESTDMTLMRALVQSQATELERLRKDAEKALRAELVAPAAAPEQPASKALQDVATERQRQDAKWGGPEHDDTHPISDWQRFISQRAENLVYRGNPERMYELFIEIAALAVAAAESIDRKGTP